MKNSTPVNTVRLTRITNACVLIEMGEHAVLTDPWFNNPWGFNEEPGILTHDLPPLTAIIGSHFAPDHWGIDALAHRADRESIPVFTSTNGMAKKAKTFGFQKAQRLDWGASTQVAENLMLEVVPAQKFFGKASNNYVLSNGSTRLFFGGETRDLQPLRDFRARREAVDIALAPANGMRLLGYRLVTTAKEGLEAASILGAKTFVPIHDSMVNIGIGGPTSSARELISQTEDGPQTLLLEAGKPVSIVVNGLETSLKNDRKQAC